jgi:hypothetical protein
MLAAVQLLTWLFVGARNFCINRTARSYCRFVLPLRHPLHTRFAKLFGASVSEAMMRPNPRLCWGRHRQPRSAATRMVAALAATTTWWSEMPEEW